jgi:hypothetical protein
MTHIFLQIRRRRLEKISAISPVNDRMISPDKDVQLKDQQSSAVGNYKASSSSKIESDVTAESRMLNLALEGILLVTLRKDSARHPIVYLENASNLSTSLLSSTILSEVICSRLSGTDSLSAVTYLVGCYKRLLSKEVIVSPAIAKELSRSVDVFSFSSIVYSFSSSCKAQLVSFLTSCLGLPDMFEEKSANSIADFTAVLKEDSSPVIITLMKDLADELEKQDYLCQVNTFLLYLDFFFFPVSL